MVGGLGRAGQGLDGGAGWERRGRQVWWEIAFGSAFKGRYGCELQGKRGCGALGNVKRDGFLLETGQWVAEAWSLERGCWKLVFSG